MGLARSGWHEQTLVPDTLWAVEPLLPPEPPKPKGGRLHLPERAALTGILFVPQSGILWEMLPQEMGCGMTCWHHLRAWQEAGVWGRLQPGLLDRLGRHKGIDFRRAAVDSASVAAKRGCADEAEPTDRGKPARSATLSPMPTASISRFA